MATNHVGQEPREYRRLPGLPVFVYHGLLKAGAAPPVGRPTREGKYWIGASQLRQQLALTAQQGYVIKLLHEWVAGADLPWTVATVFTFDDGDRSHYEVAYPLLLAAGARAHFFVNTATVGSLSHLSWPQIQEMHNHGMSLDSHSHSHCYLTHCTPQELRRQLRISKQVLEDHLGDKVQFLAVPYGDFNKRVLETAKEEGYRALCTGRSWPSQRASYIVDRTVIINRTGNDQFESFLSRDVWSYGQRAARAAILSLPKQIWLHFSLRGRNMPTYGSIS